MAIGADTITEHNGVSSALLRALSWLCGVLTMARTDIKHVLIRRAQPASRISIPQKCSSHHAVGYTSPKAPGCACLHETSFPLRCMPRRWAVTTMPLANAQQGGHSWSVSASTRHQIRQKRLCSQLALRSHLRYGPRHHRVAYPEAQRGHAQHTCILSKLSGSLS
jgi:hypothetical protein